MSNLFTDRSLAPAAQKMTPFLTQYLEVKSRHKDSLLFFRMGDFYELFFEDARTAAHELEIALTARNKTEANPIPMCGVPHHAATNYINRLVSRGYKVALCEQLEDPATAKGIVKRDVVQVISPGTQFDTTALVAKSLNLTHAALRDGERVAFASCDYSTGAFHFGVFENTEQWEAYLRTQPVAEVIIPDNEAGSRLAEAVGSHAFVQRVAEHYFDDAYATARLAEQFGTTAMGAIHKRLTDGVGCRATAGALVKYFQETQKGAAGGHIPLANRLELWSAGGTMDLDPATIAALDLAPLSRASSGTPGDRATVLGLLDHTRTAMGGRALRQRLLRPLTDAVAIGSRLADVQWFVDHPAAIAQRQSHLTEVYDLERLVVRAALATMNARELLNLSASLASLQDTARILRDEHDCGLGVLTDLASSLTDELLILAENLNTALAETPPLSVKEGGLFRRGVDPRLDELMDLTEHGTQWLAEFEAREKTTTGISSLKVRFNRVFGYYIEITKSNVANAPGHYVRKQTTAGGERYITEELKTFEDKILNAESRRHALEYELFQGYRAQVAARAQAVGTVARAAAALDATAALAAAALARGFTRPEVDTSADLEIIGGRHPLVELRGGFVPNNVAMTAERGHFLFITGPNMGGKSTVMRQTALIALMAQAGSFVPAARARIGVCDRIFTRIGASDNIAEGQSTFMVEMSEMSFILRNATARSLILLDEVGRGTSTFDGLSLAWALAEEILVRVGARCMFATHYHELTELAAHHPQAVNLQVAVDCREGEDVRFLYTLEPGAARRSYGISVAKLAGLSPRVLKRAEAVLARLEARRARSVTTTSDVADAAPQLGLGL